MTAFGGVPFESEEYRKGGDASRLGYHFVLLEEHILLAVVGEGNEIETSVSSIQMRLNKFVAFAVVVHVAADPSQGRGARGCLHGHLVKSRRR